MKRSNALLLPALAALMLGVATPALASPPGGLQVDHDGDHRTVVPIPTEPHGPDDAAPVAGPVADDVPPTVTVRTFRALDDGTYCEGRRTMIVPDGFDERQLIETHNRSVFQAIDRTAPGSFVGRCPDDPTDPVPPVTPQDIVAVLEGQLDRPQPRVEPGFALAGLRMYLETDRPLTHQETITVTAGGLPIGIEVDATATYTVDWGDGTVTGPHDDPGAPHPDGRITHVWTDVGTYDVTVTDTWSIRWRFLDSGWNAPFEAELTGVVLPDLEVQERRAVRTG